MFKHITSLKIDIWADTWPKTKLDYYNKSRGDEIIQLINHEFNKYDLYSELIHCLDVNHIIGIGLKSHNICFQLRRQDMSIQLYCLVSMGTENEKMTYAGQISPRFECYNNQLSHYFLSYFYKEISKDIEDGAIKNIMGELDNHIIEGVLSSV